MSERYATRGQLISVSTTKPPDAPEPIEVYAFDPEDLKRTTPPESDDERLQRVERCMLALTEEWMMLTGQAEPPVPVPERERMRRVIEAMRPIVDAAMLYIDELHGDAGWDNLDQLRMFVAAGRSRLAAAMSAWKDSQTWSADELWLGQLLTADEWKALDRARDCFPYDGSWTLVRSAIGKLLAANARRTP